MMNSFQYLASLTKKKIKRTFDKILNFQQKQKNSKSLMVNDVVTDIQVIWLVIY